VQEIKDLVTKKSTQKYQAKTGEKSGSRCEGPSAARTVAGERSQQLIL